MSSGWTPSVQVTLTVASEAVVVREPGALGDAGLRLARPAVPDRGEGPFRGATAGVGGVGRRWLGDDHELHEQLADVADAVRVVEGAAYVGDEVVVPVRTVSPSSSSITIGCFLSRL